MADSLHQKELVAELAASRSQISGYVSALRHDLDVGSRIRRGVSHNPAAWFGGAAVIGLLLSRVVAGRRKVVVKGPSFHRKEAQSSGRAALFLSALQIGMDFAKPALVSWVKSRFSDYATRNPRGNAK